MKTAGCGGIWPLKEKLTAGEGRSAGASTTWIHPWTLGAAAMIRASGRSSVRLSGLNCDGRSSIGINHVVPTYAVVRHAKIKNVFDAAMVRRRETRWGD